MSKKHGLKETKDLIAAVKSLSLDSLEALKDGADLTDINVLFKNLDPIQEALKGIDMVDDEIGDLDPAEIKELINEGVDLVFALVDKVKELKKKDEVAKA